MVLALAVGVAAVPVVARETPNNEDPANTVRAIPDALQALEQLPDQVTFVLHHPDGATGQRAAPSNCITYPERLVYSNTAGTFLHRPGAVTTGAPVADDVQTLMLPSCHATRYRVWVSGGVEGGGGTFNVGVSLHNGCPRYDAPQSTLAPIGGYGANTTLGYFTSLDDNIQVVHILEVEIPATTVIPPSVYVRMQFSTQQAGWLCGAPAHVGYSADLYFSGNLQTCNTFFGGYPYSPHGSFNVDVYADAECIGRGPRPSSGYPHAGAKNKYITFAPDPEILPGALHGYQVRHVDSGVSWFISTPRVTPLGVQSLGLTYLVSDAAPPRYDFGSMPTIHVGGCMIAPGELYEVRSTHSGVLFSDPLVVATAPIPSDSRWWADVVGEFTWTGRDDTCPPTLPGTWSPPDGAVNAFDIAAVMQGAAQENTAPHPAWIDLDGEIGDRLVSGRDVLRVVNAFTLQPGRAHYPYRVPDAVGPQGQPQCPPPPLQASLPP